jgi:hypothetical protein
MQNDDSRILLFKMPAGGRNFAQKLLDILCYPSNALVKLTTYAEPWVNHGIFDNPKQLDGREALLVCVDAEQIEKKFVLKGLYPLREIKIRVKDPVHEGKFLSLWVEMGGYVRPCDYNKYTDELKRDLQKLPPQEGSFIQYDRLRSLEIVPANDATGTVSTWQSLARQLSLVDIYRNAAFYTIEEIRRNKELVRIEGNTYALVEGRQYELRLTTLLPNYGTSGGRDSFEIALDSPSLLMSKDRIEFFGKQQTETTLLAAKSSEGVIDPSLRIEDAGGSSQTITAPPGLVPRLEIKLKLLKPSFLRRVFHFLTHIVAPAAPFVLAYGIAEWYQEVEKYRLAGASVSSPMLFVFPAISSLMLLAIPIIIAYSVSRKST